MKQLHLSLDSSVRDAILYRGSLPLKSCNHSSFWGLTKEYVLRFSCVALFNLKYIIEPTTKGTSAQHKSEPNP